VLDINLQLIQSAVDANIDEKMGHALINKFNADRRRLQMEVVVAPSGDIKFVKIVK